MTSTALARQSATMSTKAARLAMGAMVAYQVLLSALIFLRPDLAPSWHSISEWAIGRYGWIMSGAFLISALSYGALFAMVRSQLRDTLGRIGLGLLLLCVIGAAGVGLFTTDPMPMRSPLSTRGTLHVISGKTQLVLPPFAALFINLSLARGNQAWAIARWALLWTAGLPFFGFAAFCAVHGDFRPSARFERLWSRSQHWLASSVRVLHLHVVGRYAESASDDHR